MGTRVFVGGLTQGVRERDLERFFHKYGRIKEVSMKNGFAFVEFYDYRDADDAVYKLNGKELLGERVSVEIARGTPRGSDQYKYGYGGGGGGRGYGGYGPPPTRTEHRLVVKNLSSRVTWQILKYYMGQAGEVTFADAHKKVRNEGIVEFGSYSDMKNALNKLDDTELKGRRIRLMEDKRRGGGYGRGRSRSSSRSRSPARRSRSRSRRRSPSSRSKSRGRSNSKSSGHSRSKSKEPSKSRSRSPARRSKSSSRSRGGDSPKEREK